MKRILALSALGLAIEGLFLFLALGVGTDIPEVWKFTLICLSAFFLYLLSILVLARAGFDKKLFQVILFFAVAFLDSLATEEVGPQSTSLFFATMTT